MVEEMRPMPMKFELPLREGPNSLGSVTFEERVYSPSQFNIGSLEKKAFSDLGSWMILKREKCYVGLRIGIKDPFLDDEGKLSTLVIFFMQYMQSKSNPINEGGYDREIETLQGVLKQVMLERSYTKRTKMCGLIMEPPEYMLEELKEKLKIK